MKTKNKVDFQRLLCSQFAVCTNWVTFIKVPLQTFLLVETFSFDMLPFLSPALESRETETVFKKFGSVNFSEDQSNFSPLLEAELLPQTTAKLIHCCRRK